MLAVVLPLAVAHAAGPDFGPNVTIFDPTMPVSTIQNAVNAISQTQVPASAQFNTVRHAFLFKPGTYTVDVQVGYLHLGRRTGPVA
jgi:type IV secretory pathway TraG/TraD family ATPase VirD4